MVDALKDWELEALVFAPLWVHTTVALASGTSDPSQFRRFRELIDVPDPTVEGSESGGAAVATLRTTFEAAYARYVDHGGDPRKGLERARKILDRVADHDREAFTRWLLEIAIRVAEASRVLGEPPISDAEVKAIRDVAKWLGAPNPDLGPR